MLRSVQAYRTGGGPAEVPHYITGLPAPCHALCQRLEIAQAYGSENDAVNAMGSWVMTWSIRSQPQASDDRIVVSEMGEH